MSVTTKERGKARLNEFLITFGATRCDAGMKREAVQIGQCTSQKVVNS